MKRPAFLHARVVFILLMAAVTFSCSFISITDTSGIGTIPARANDILPQNALPSIAFTFDVVRDQAESLFRITSMQGNASGYITWNGNVLVFNPVPELVYGRRYVLECRGAVRDTSGANYTLRIEVPFYYRSQSVQPPAIASIAPTSGNTTGTLNVLTITFTKAVDSFSFKKAFSLSPDTPYDVGWTSTSVVTITPQEMWNNHSLYTVKISEDLKDTLGIPLAYTFESVFLVEEDTVNPQLPDADVVPAFNDWNPIAPFPTVAPTFTLSDLQYTNAIRITFSEAMDRDSVAGAFSLMPSVTGQTTWIDDMTFVFVPEDGYTMDTTYTFVMNKSATDRNKNPLLVDYIRQFVPAIPILEATSIEFVNDSIVVTSPAYSTTTAVEIDVGVSAPYNYEFIITFNRAIDAAHKVEALSKVNISCIFPPSAGSPLLEGFTWVSDNILSVTWTGFSPATASQKYYYMFEVQGESTGNRNSEGSFLKKNVRQLLRTGG